MPKIFRPRQDNRRTLEVARRKFRLRQGARRRRREGEDLSIAYEFAQEVCRVKPYQLEKVIWLTAKSSQFVAEADRYVNVPETHFSCTESLLRAICSELAILDEETEGASVPLLKKILRAALALVPTLVVVDDVDSVEPEEQKGIIETAIQMASSQARFLLTTRMNFYLSSHTCITVGGLERAEYREYVKSIIQKMGMAVLQPKQIEAMRVATDGSPLFTESLLRLCRAGDSLNAAIVKWKGKLGDEVRKAALKREIETLSMEGRRVLLACSLMREASVTELRQVTGYEDERMMLCMVNWSLCFFLLIRNSSKARGGSRCLIIQHYLCWLIAICW